MRRVLALACALALPLLSCSAAPEPCGPSTCATGCCDNTGTCLAGSAPTACGSGGFACTSCGAGFFCGNGTCLPSATGGGGGSDVDSGVGGGGGDADSGVGGGGGNTGGGAGGGLGGGGGNTGGGGGGMVSCTVPSTLDWGLVATGGTSSRTLTLSNPTAADVTATIGAITGPDAAAFSASGATGTVVIPAGGSVTTTFTLAPTSDKTWTASVSVQPAATCGATQVTLTGTSISTALGFQPATLDFSCVPLGASLEKAVTVTNVSGAPVQLTGIGVFSGSVPSTEFRVVAPGASATVPANSSLTIQVGFTPATLGPKNAALRFNTSLAGQPAVSVPIRGFGGGAVIEVTPQQLDFGTVGYFAQGPGVTRSLVVRNVGTRPSPANPACNLHLGLGGQLPYFTLTPMGATSASEFSAAFATSYDPAVGLEAGASVVLDVTAAPVSIGAKGATLTVHSDDLVRPNVAVPLSANATALPPCSFSLSSTALNFGLVTPGTARDLWLTVKNTGATASDVCALSGIELAPTSHAAFSLVGGPVASLTLQPGESRGFQLRVTSTGTVPTTPTAITGALRFGVSNPTTPSVSVPLSAQLGLSCLVLAPGAVDFGTVARNCSSATRTVNVFNTCTTAVTVSATSLAYAAGEPAGGPNCAGASPCPEYSLVTSIAPNTVIAASTFATLTVKYRPINLGADHGVLRLAALQNGTAVDVVTTLDGVGDAMGRNVDTYAVPATQKTDVLFVVDNSCSMDPKQQALAGNIASFVQGAQALGIDFQVGVTTMDMTLAGARGRLVGSPLIVRPTTPNAALAFANNVRVGINGSAVEEALSPALAGLTAPLVTADNAGLVRPDARLAVVTVSDAEDQSPLPVSWYTALLGTLKRPGDVTLSAFAPKQATPPAMCTYDGGGPASRTQFAAQTLGGVVEEICTTTWNNSVLTVTDATFGPKRRYFLTAAPAPATTVEVRINGQLVPEFVGTFRAWTFDAVTSTITFDPSYAPQPGATASFTYSTPCLP